MSLKPKPPSTELDHIRDTLACLVEVVGGTRQDVREVRQHLSYQDNESNKFKQETRERFDQHDQEFAALKDIAASHDKRLDKQGIRLEHLESDMGEVKSTLKQLLAR